VAARVVSITLSAAAIAEVSSVCIQNSTVDVEI